MAGNVVEMFILYMGSKGLMSCRVAQPLCPSTFVDAF